MATGSVSSAAPASIGKEFRLRCKIDVGRESSDVRGSAAGDSSVEYVVGRLNEASLLQQMKEIASRYSIYIIWSHQPQASHIAIFVNEHGLGAGMSETLVVHHLQRTLLTQAAPPLLIRIVSEVLLSFSVRLCWDNSNEISSLFGPLNDIISTRHVRIANRFEVNAIRDENLDSRSRQQFEGVRGRQGQQRPGIRNDDGIKLAHATERAFA